MNKRVRQNIFISLSIITCLAVTASCKTPRYAGAPPPSYDVDADLKQLADQFKPGLADSNYYALSTNAAAPDRNKIISGRLVMINLEYLKWIRTHTLGEHLRKKRIDMGFSMTQLAQKLGLGITNTAVEKWEKNQNRPTTEHRNRIVDFLGFDPFHRAF